MLASGNEIVHNMYKMGVFERVNNGSTETVLADVSRPDCATSRNEGIMEGTGDVPALHKTKKTWAWRAEAVSDVLLICTQTVSLRPTGCIRDSELGSLNHYLYLKGRKTNRK